jgi:hypothetical protein
MAVTRNSDFHGRALWPRIDGFNLQSHFVDGPHVHQYLGSNPLARSDLLGLGLMDLMEMDSAMGALQYAEGQICRLLAQHYAKMVIASELAYGLAQGDSNPAGGSLWGAEASEALAAMRGFANGKYTGSMLEEFSSATFRANTLRMWGLEGNLFSSILRAHHIIPQAEAIGEIMSRLGVSDMVHNPIFSSLLTQAEHDIIHAGSGPGGWYNRMWLAGLQRIEGSGLRGIDAANAIIDFIGREVIPAVREALQRGGPPPGF